jgi:hypothetical protein
MKRMSFWVYAITAVGLVTSIPFTAGGGMTRAPRSTASRFLVDTVNGRWSAWLTKQATFPISAPSSETP